ncbi:MAG: SUF system NifU family Fe-S cluster assembly protein [Bacteroidetes bacterium]|nr:SUF system NifU family Fe-S cluster assembly protein [Bacteroidota bacterium]MDA1121557.1 SUF system NifU family Fe-S cluster assembly protein [Bacteroidota bacterium]
MDKMRDLYKEVILELNENPIDFKSNPGAQYVIEAYNPVCGDQYKIYFDLKDDTISNFSYHGYGCAISKASGSIMMKLMGSRKIDEALNVYILFESMISGEHLLDIPKDFQAFTAVQQHPGRIKCVTLLWDEMATALNSLKKT